MTLFDIENFGDEPKPIGEERILWKCKRCEIIYARHLPYRCDCHHSDFEIVDLQEATKFFENNPDEFASEAKKMLKQNKKDELTELLTSIFKTHRKTYTTRFDEKNEMFVYENGIYLSEGKSKVKEFCRTILLEKYTEQLSNRVINKIEADTFVEQKDFLKRHYPNQIAVKNGILNLETKELSPFTPEKIFFNKINANYSPTAECPNIDKFLHDILLEKKDVQTIYEWFGYCLIGGYPIQKMLLCIGEGENGKGQLLKLLCAVLGEGNYCAIPLQKLEDNDFKENELFGKYANIGADISDNPLKTTAKIKGLSGGDEINASRKFKTDLTFQNEAKMVFSANKLPKTYDLTRAFFRRWLYLTFPCKFVTENELKTIPIEKRAFCKKAQTEITKKIINENELSGLLCKSIEGLNKIMQTGEFTTSPTSEETKNWWIQHSDSFLAFCWDCIIEDPNAEPIKKEELRKEYQKYCKKNKLVAEGDKHIHEVLTRQILAWDEQIGYGERAWGGIAIKQDKVVEN